LAAVASKNIIFYELNMNLPRHSRGLPADDSAQSRALHAVVQLTNTF